MQKGTDHLCIPLRGNSVCILFISTEHFGLYFEITIFKILNIYASANDNYSLLRNVYKFFDVYECET